MLMANEHGNKYIDSLLGDHAHPTHPKIFPFNLISASEFPKGILKVIYSSHFFVAVYSYSKNSFPSVMISVFIPVFSLSKG